MSDLAPDRHLQAALAHAPDRDEAAPAALTATILAAARREVQPPASRWAWLDRWLQPAPAAALAGVVLGTTVLVLWRGEVPPQAMPDAAGPAATEAAAPTAATASTTAAASTMLAPAAPAASTVATVTPPAAARSQAERLLTRTPEPLPAPPAAPAPAPAAATAKATADELPRMAAETARPAPAAVATDASAAPPPSRAAAAARAVAIDPLADVLPRLSAPAREAVSALQQAAAGRWRITATPMPDDATVLRDDAGQPLARAHRADDHVLWQRTEGDTRVWRADLPADAISGLQESWSTLRR